MATGRCGQSEIDNTADPRYAQLKALLGSLALELAQAIVRDGEAQPSSSRLKCKMRKLAKRRAKVAYAVAHSPLVKTAFFASDPNLGRLLAAVGYAGIEDLDVDALKMWLDDVLVAEKRRPCGKLYRRSRTSRDESSGNYRPHRFATRRYDGGRLYLRFVARVCVD